MLKYQDVKIGLQEIPGEVSLVINIANCPYKCPYCNTRQLRKDEGEILTKDALDTLLDTFMGEYTCVCFMGGDLEPETIDSLAEYIHHTRLSINVAWYSGADSLTLFTDVNNFDYIKLGRYIKKLGALSSPKTNQKLYRILDRKLIDITDQFWAQ